MTLPGVLAQTSETIPSWILPGTIGLLSFVLLYLLWVVRFSFTSRKSTIVDLLTDAERCRHELGWVNIRFEWLLRRVRKDGTIRIPEVMFADAGKPGDPYPTIVEEVYE